MNQLACDVNLSEQAELWRLEGGISWSDERYNAPLVPGFTDEFAGFLWQRMRSCKLRRARVTR